MKIDRLIAMIMILLENEVMNAGALAKKLEVSNRTIYRDIDTLTMAGLPIFTTQGVAGGVGLMKSYKIDKKLFTLKDVQTLSTSLESYRQLYDHKEIVNVLEKLNCIRREGGQSKKESRYAIDLSLNQGNQSLRSLLSSIETALSKERYMVFDYIDKDGNVTTRKIEPYQVVFKESSWYLQAFCTLKEDYRIFKLARMSRLYVLPETFVPRDFSPLAMEGSDWISREWVPVTIRIALSIKDKVIERYGEENIISVEGNSCLATFPIINNESGYDVLLRFGDKCEIIEPSDIREAFQNYIRRILANYEEQ
ncbi:YafY family transcriptional regulator [Paenibacillus sp. MER TA 81-3]|uniref:helix-turn-helix transcriptional regulator n=1 Tax=Paenibacillus sp. MER TA 81-3 TaxID=2939573 RepID=UPI00203AA8A2|nr:YafY family protein [Paenibacillus sp. MER TA 81-3]MCM3342444.1 YafY family transcriptional regulator [Paenibacillus sp. MER TA 81-3]